MFYAFSKLLFSMLIICCIFSTYIYVDHFGWRVHQIWILNDGSSRELNDTLDSGDVKVVVMTKDSFSAGNGRKNLCHDSDQITEVRRSQPSISTIDLIETCFKPQKGHVICFGGAVKPKDLRSSQPTAK
ncbi:hypothetical protein Dimus_026323 [Dionaea muscipula]